ncbi:MAG: carbohydrate ABC transporter permease [Bifidobacteriaceae bacterium]|nr:carbohydrate ABC transporter permease [Bifidobacteriaceae bacterium]
MTPSARTPRATDRAGAGRRQTKTRARGGAVTAASHTLLGLWISIVIIPFLWTVMCSFKTTREILTAPLALPERWSLDNYVNAWTEAGVGRYFFNTAIVVGCALVLVMVLGGMCAYVLARFRFRGRMVIYYSMIAAMAFPAFLAIVPLFLLLQDLRLLNTKPGLVAVYVAFALPFTVFFLHSFFASLPNDVSEAAQIDGAGDWRTYFQVMLPMAAPGMASVAILNFIGLWNQYMLAVVLNSKKENYVLTQGMQVFAQKAGYSVDFGGLFAAVVMTVVPVLIVYMVFQRRLQGSVSQGTFR